MELQVLSRCFRETYDVLKSERLEAHSDFTEALCNRIECIWSEIDYDCSVIYQDSLVYLVIRDGEVCHYIDLLTYVSDYEMNESEVCSYLCDLFSC